MKEVFLGKACLPDNENQHFSIQTLVRVICLLYDLTQTERDDKDLKSGKLVFVSVGLDKEKVFTVKNSLKPTPEEISTFLIPFVNAKDRGQLEFYGDD